jgi:hypothetical protein
VDAEKRAIRHRKGQGATAESLLEALNELNPDVGILSITDDAFRRFGEVHEGFRVESLLGFLEQNAKVGNSIVYEPDAVGMGRFPDETLPLQRAVFGGVTDLQAGWLYGRSSSLAALEYHKCAEVIVAGADQVVFLGLAQDIAWPEGSYDISRVTAFFFPRGTVCEISPCSLHSAPIHVRGAEGFRCIVILPRGTHAPLDFPAATGGEGRLLQGRNTWLIAHSSGSTTRDASLHLGLKGRDIELTTL